MNAASHEGAPARWELLEERTVQDCRVFRVQARRMRHPRRNRAGEFFVLEAPDWVGVVAETADGRVVMVEQFRFGTRELSLELPGGAAEPGEDPLAAAVRELREETGYAGTAARLLGTVRPNPAIQSNRFHVVLVTGCTRVAATEWDAHEELALALPTAAEAVAHARAGRVTHALMVAALFFYETERRPPPAGG